MALTPIHGASCYSWFMLLGPERVHPLQGALHSQGFQAPVLGWTDILSVLGRDLTTGDLVWVFLVLVLKDFGI